MRCDHPAGLLARAHRDRPVGVQIIVRNAEGAGVATRTLWEWLYHLRDRVVEDDGSIFAGSCAAAMTTYPADQHRRARTGRPGRRGRETAAGDLAAGRRLSGYGIMLDPSRKEAVAPLITPPREGNWNFKTSAGSRANGQPNGSIELLRALSRRADCVVLPAAVASGRSRRRPTTTAPMPEPGREWGRSRPSAGRGRHASTLVQIFCSMRPRRRSPGARPLSAVLKPTTANGSGVKVDQWPVRVEALCTAIPAGPAGGHVQDTVDDCGGGVVMRVNDQRTVHGWWWGRRRHVDRRPGRAAATTRCSRPSRATATASTGHWSDARADQRSVPGS